MIPRAQDVYPLFVANFEPRGWMGPHDMPVIPGRLVTLAEVLETSMDSCKNLNSLQAVR